MREQLKPALLLFLWLTLLTGIVYPLLVTVVGQLCFPAQANGSLIDTSGKYTSDPGAAAGSLLIGQAFTSPGYFWSRPSATGPYLYNAGASSGSNLGPINSALDDAVRGRITALSAAGTDTTSGIPVDLVTASGSGLDPHISPAAALYQVPRIAQARGVKATQLESLVREHIEGRSLGLLGEPRVNVLQLNLALDQLAAVQHGSQ